MPIVLFVSWFAGCSTNVPKTDVPATVGGEPGDDPEPDIQIPAEIQLPIDDDRDGHDASTDCDDDDPTIFPGATEIPYDGIDQDCDDGDLVDVDDDGAAALQVGGDDCDDADPTIHPLAADVPYDGIDQDCVDGDLIDADGDGVIAIEAGGADCNDQDPLTAPGRADTVGDGIDQSCDGLDGTDGDLDGYAADTGGGDDCDDADPRVNPVATETWYDGVDQDCDGACEGDQDGDGSVLEGWVVTDGDACDVDGGVAAYAPTDCNDTDPLAEALLLATSPAADATDARPWRDVRATLYAFDPAGVLGLTDSAGAAIAGVSSWSGSTLVFTPDAPLETLATYTAALTWGCGTEIWSFTTSDGTEQDFLHTWTSGAPNTLRIDVVNPVATLYGFGMAETGTGAVGWYGEDCAGASATGSCHPMVAPLLVLESVSPFVGLVVPGTTTLFDATFDPGITYFVEARDGPQQGACWAWGNDPAYFSWCGPL